MTGPGRTLTLAVALVGALLASAVASGAQERSPEELDALTKQIASQLRCPVCRQLSVEDSPSDLAREVKGVIRDKLEEGATPEEVRAYFVSKYGEWILLEPPKEGFNLLVWVTPLLALLGGGTFLAVQLTRWMRREEDGSPGRVNASFPLILALALTAGLTACGDALPDHVKEDARRRQLRELGVEHVEPTGGARRAGVSAIRRIDLEPLDPSALGEDTASAAYHRFLHRCGACHEAPAPSQHTASEWSAVFTRMHRNIEDAGLIPVSGPDREAILEFLGRHAKEK